MSISDDLNRLAELREKGVLTQQEFEDQKAKLLASNDSYNPPIPGKNKSRAGKGCLTLLAFFVLVFVILAAIGSSVHKDSTVVAPTGPDVTDTKPFESSSSDSTNGVTMDNFNRIHNGMTYAKVVAILGQPTQELSRSEIAGTETVMYEWDGGGMANMNAMFQNGKLISKAQLGLR